MLCEKKTASCSGVCVTGRSCSHALHRIMFDADVSEAINNIRRDREGVRHTKSYMGTLARYDHVCNDSYGESFCILE